MKNKKSLKVSGVFHNCKVKKAKLFYEVSYLKNKPYCKHCGEIIPKEKILDYEVSDCQ